MYKMYNTDPPTLKWSTLIRPRLNDENLFGHGGTVVQGGSREEARRARPLLFLDQTEAQRAEKNLFWDRPTPPPLFI